MLETIQQMATRNIGSLCSFLNNEKNIEFLNFVNNNIPNGISNLTISERVYYLVNNIQDLLLCSCGRHRSFIGFKSGYRKTCSDKNCYVKRRRETCIQNWGVDNPKKSKVILEREKENIKKNWNGKHYMQNAEVIKKFKETMKKRWGVEWAQQSKEISAKSSITFHNNENKNEIIEKRKISLLNKSEDEKNEIKSKTKKTIESKWGTYENFIKWRLIKIQESSLDKWGCVHHLKNEYIKKKRVETYKNRIIDKIKEIMPNNLSFIGKRGNENETDTILKFKCEICLNEFEINRQLFVFRTSNKENVCMVCNPNLSGKSKREIEIANFIKENYRNEVLTNAKNIISKELDIYLPDINLAFEFNGLYWHSDLYKNKFFHLEKTNECNDKSTQLIHIWEDDWDFKKGIVQSMILNKLGKSKKIGARKCQIKIINDNKLVREFLQNNHIQGFVGSKIKLGLYFKDELVSIMTFGNLRRSLGQKSKTDTYELLRFCNKLNTVVVGGANKLFKFFVKNYKPEEVISYSDSSRSQGDIYLKLGFEFSHNSPPNYYWIINNQRKHRFNYRKDRLLKMGKDSNKSEVQIMNEDGYYRLWDCGTKKWIYKTLI